ncbi:iron-containing alcohol dehydrogenase [uncultured Nevskia sp.]|uniref:iron-containing alcohol dehydrogenase n=1 Tax=uncultured Nevskia sp. TaxID=228950 RepID=UPI0025E0C3C8|nr:iron-containing alcohol dehydrogenase [uncultured Nevskia sp.]
MIPFSIQVFVFKIFQFLLKWSTKLLTFRTPELFSGPGSSLQLCDHIATRTGVKNLLIVTDGMLVKLGLLKPMQDRLTELGVRYVVYDGVLPNPTIDQIETGLAMLKREGCTAILAIGGGSSIDAAKVIAARARNPHKIVHMAGLMRVFFKPMPLYAVPTTAGTGSEVTIAAVVSDPSTTRKFAIMDPKLVPIGAALDGALMTGLPAHITAATGMDALTHAVEAYISRNHTPMTDAEALDATRLIMQNLPTAVTDGGNIEARQNMAVASFKAGVAFTTAGVGYVHAIAHNFGAYYHMPHGLANAVVLPRVLDFSKPECIPRLAKLAEVSGLKHGGESDAQLADAFIAHVRKLNADFGIPTQVEKLKASDIPAITGKALSEAHWTYAVPRYMDNSDCQAFISQMLP